ncbi:MAG: hypothetical protein JWO30_3711 [Fibrobacteres bacterium]|nr:hypothetical protein [Fibrobacterota bacterium]
MEDTMNSVETRRGKLAAISASLLLGWTASVHALPAPWIDKDIGSVGVAGSAAESGGLWSIYGSGADIWGNADAFNFAYQALSGNTTIIAKINSVANTNAWAKAGVMIRQDLTAGAKNAFVAVTPSNGVAFQYRAALNGASVNTNTTGLAAPYWVKLVRSGDAFTAFRSPDGSAWTQIGAAQTIPMTGTVYVGLAATSHDNTRLGSASAISVQIINTPPPAGVLLVAGSASLTSADAFIKRRLETLGYAVTVKAAAASVSGDAAGKGLIVISSTVSSGDVNTKFTTSAVPLITWENAILDDLGMTGTVGGTDYGTTDNQTQAAIFTSACDRATMYTAAKNYADGCQDLAAGLTGTSTLYNQPAQISWGKPGPNAIKIASQADNTAKVIDFAYDANVAMPGRTAPARRVFLFFSDLTPGAISTGRALALFDNAVYWATNNKYYTVKKALVLTFSPILTTQGNQRLHEYGRAHWNWDNPVVMATDYLADLTEASGGYVRWKVANYPSIPSLLNTWGPITGSVQFNTPQFTESDYLNAYQYAINTGDWVGATQRMPSQGNYGADYNALMDQYGVDAKVNAGEVDEVIVWGFPYAGYFESAMGGSTSYWINGTPFTRPTPNFFVMGFNYERTVGLAEHAFGHRAEQLVGDHAFGTPPPIPYNGCMWPDFTAGCGSRQPTVIRNIWDRFSVVEGNLPGQAGVGVIHWPPNLVNHSQEYVYWSFDNYYSQADDWLYNYPLLQGASTRRLMNQNEWLPMAQDGEIQRGFVKWYFQHYPRVTGRYSDGTAANSNRLNNWWEYAVNFNLYPETQH